MRMFFLWLAVSLFVPNLMNAQLDMLDLSEKMHQEERYVVMNISTADCIYCKMQKKKLEGNPILQKRLAEEVYFLQWQPRQLLHFSWNDAEYVSGNDFLEKVMQKNTTAVGFPLWLVFDSSGRLIYQNEGLLSERQICQVLDLLKKQKY